MLNRKHRCVEWQSKFQGRFTLPHSCTTLSLFLDPFVYRCIDEGKPGMRAQKRCCSSALLTTSFCPATQMMAEVTVGLATEWSLPGCRGLLYVWWNVGLFLHPRYISALQGPKTDVLRHAFILKQILFLHEFKFSFIWKTLIYDCTRQNDKTPAYFLNFDKWDILRVEWITYWPLMWGVPGSIPGTEEFTSQIFLITNW